MLRALLIDDDDDFLAGLAEVAEQEGVAFVDLHNLVAARYEELGQDAVNGLFGDAHTHTSRTGAIESAVIVAEALRALPGDPLGAFAR